jgi:D-glycero-D-manno-heptose 1,7-bisphosphate phosphatase
MIRSSGMNQVQRSPVAADGGNASAVRHAVFFDRDGVIVNEVHLLTDVKNIQIPQDVPDALRRLKNAGFQLIIVSNQTVVSRGLITESQVSAINSEIEARLVQAGAPALDGWYICPHHPQATLPEYRVNCDCRKPRSGMLLQAAREHNLNLKASFMVGDRITDSIAGAHAGCRTVLLTTGAHELPPIQTADPLDTNVKPDFTCGTLAEAADWILQSS